MAPKTPRTKLKGKIRFNTTTTLTNKMGEEKVDEESVDGVGISAPPRNTAKANLPDSCVIRKSPHGRAMLFTDDIPFQDLRCSSSITQHVQRHSIFHRHEQNGRLGNDFNKKTNMCCWHCCHSFDTPPIPLVKDFDTATGNYVVMGNFCSLACSKAYAMESCNFNSGLQIILQEKMAREVYGVSGIVAAPPRLALDCFGGPYSLEQFRKSEKRVVMHKPPFVCAYHVIEERDQQHDISVLDINAPGSVRGLRRGIIPIEDVPQVATQSAYEKFLAEAGTSSSAPSATATTSKKTAAAPPLDGTLAAFME